MNNILGFLKDVRAELNKVNWPTRTQTFQYTLMVLGISFAMAIYLGLLDFGFTQLLNKFIL
jgi:preprotein translocase subunit SecE